MRKKTLYSKFNKILKKILFRTLTLLVLVIFLLFLLAFLFFLFLFFLLFLPSIPRRQYLATPHALQLSSELSSLQVMFSFPISFSNVLLTCSAGVPCLGDSEESILKVAW